MLGNHDDEVSARDVLSGTRHFLLVVLFLVFVLGIIGAIAYLRFNL